MSAAELAIISGIGPGPTGTGMLLRGLMDEALESRPPVSFIHRRSSTRHRGLAKWRMLNPLRLAGPLHRRWIFPLQAKAAAKVAAEVVLMHPQTLGFPLFREVVESRRRTWLYVLDAYVFCRRSYNCLPGESLPCLRCLGNDGSAAGLHGCRDSFRAGPFPEHFPGWVAAGRLGLIAQCASQAALLRRHFGPSALILVVPLCVPDVTPPSGAAPHLHRPLAVYHGSPEPAKGILHAVALARLLPDWDHLIPCKPGEYLHHFPDQTDMPPNLRFTPMSWSSGLAEAVERATAVLCPSSWSAPVEGAVLKSLARNGQVVLFPHDSSFASEIPPEARIDLDPADLPATAARLRQAAAGGAVADARRRAARAFASAYVSANGAMLEKLLAALRAARA